MRKYIVIGVGVVLLAAVNFFFFAKQKLPTQCKDVSPEVTPADPRSLMQSDTTAVVTKNGIVTGTGLTKCYDNVTEIECPKPGTPYYGQDASYSINAPSYTKLSADGSKLPDDAESWAMVRDELTGLVWEMKDKSDGKKDFSNPHDPDNIYVMGYNERHNIWAPGTVSDTETFIGDLNASRFGGYEDWRLPSITELINLQQADRRPHIDTTYFPNVWFGGDCTYWSFSICRSNMEGPRVWKACFESLLVVNDYGVNKGRAMAVRGGPASQEHEFIDNNDETVTDKTTGLMWQKASTPGKYTWKQALAYCDNLTLAGQTHWRLPTTKELHSIVDYRKIRQCIYTDYFPDTRMDTWDDKYWSSTTMAGTPRYAYMVSFENGGKHERPKSELYYVRAVRGGQLAGTVGRVGETNRN